MTSEKSPSRPTLDLPARRGSWSGALERWDLVEGAFAANAYNGDPDHLTERVTVLEQPGPGVYVMPGTGRADVLLTAVHGTNHVRDGRSKWADRGTGSLAIVLAELTGCAALVTLGCDSDANHDFSHPAKTVMVEMRDVTTVIDLHGAAHLPDSPDIEIGTAASYAPAEIVDHLMTHSGLQVLTDVVRTARNPRRIAMLAQTHGLRAVQLEIDALLRPPTGEPARRTLLLEALVGAVAALVPVPEEGSNR